MPARLAARRLGRRGAATSARATAACAPAAAACRSAGRYSVNVLPLPGVLTQADLAAQQPRQFAADRQAQAGAAVLAAGAAVGLLERLEDDLLLVRRDADAGVGDGEARAPSPARLSVVVVRVPARRRPVRRVSDTWPWCVNLNALDSRFLMICCSRLASVKIDLRQIGIEARSWKSTLFDFGDVAEGALDVAVQVVEAAARRRRRTTVPDSIFDRSRMSLISIEQVVAGRVDRLGELGLLGGQVAVGVLATAGRRG